MINKRSGHKEPAEPNDLDEVLRRMLNTPPKKKKSQKKRSEKKKPAE